MKLTENECSEALTRLLRPYFAKVSVQDVYHSINKGHSIEDDSNLLTLLIMEYFGNPPLKFEELKEDTWIWDNIECEYVFIDKAYINDKNEKKMRVWAGIISYWYIFENNRFYRKEVV